MAMKDRVNSVQTFVNEVSSKIVVNLMWYSIIYLSTTLRSTTQEDMSDVNSKNDLPGP